MEGCRLAGFLTEIWKESQSACSRWAWPIGSGHYITETTRWTAFGLFAVTSRWANLLHHDLQLASWEIMLAFHWIWPTNKSRFDAGTASLPLALQHEIVIEGIQRDLYMAVYSLGRCGKVWNFEARMAYRPTYLHNYARDIGPICLDMHGDITVEILIFSLWSNLSNQRTKKCIHNKILYNSILFW